MFEVADEGGNGLVDDMRVVAKFIIEFAVMIPRGVDDVDESDPAFNHSSGQQAVASEILMSAAGLAAAASRRFRAVDSIEFQSGLIFF